MEEMEEMELMMVSNDRMKEEESWSSHLDTVLVLQLTGIMILIYSVYQLYVRCIMEKVAKEMVVDQKSSYAMVNGQAVY